MNMAWDVSGEFLTSHLRALCLEDKWFEAERSAKEIFLGISDEQIVGLLECKFKVAGNASDIDGVEYVKDDPANNDNTEYLATLKRQHSSKILVKGLWYQPYMFITSYGPNDVSYGNPKFYITGAPGRGKCVNREWHYSSNPDKDIIAHLDVGDLVSFSFTVPVIWRNCPSPPRWMYNVSLGIAAGSTEHMQYALDLHIKNGGLLEESGDRQRYAVIANKAKEWKKIPPEEDIDPDDIYVRMPKRLSDNNLSMHGWIMKDGSMYGCFRQGHRVLAMEILKHHYPDAEVDWDHGRAIEELGGIKCLTVEDGSDPIYVMPTFPYRPTKQQEKTLASWCIKFKVKMEEY